MLDREEIKKILACTDIPMKKLGESLDIVDNQLTEIYQAMDAIRFDIEQAKKRVNE